LVQGSVPRSDPWCGVPLESDDGDEEYPDVSGDAVEKSNADWFVYMSMTAGFPHRPNGNVVA